jgi:hypothetical protein
MLTSLLPRTAPLWAALLLLTTALGCTSTRERFERAVDLEEEGRWAEASRHYIQVLEDEPNWEGARDRLRTAGANAVDAYLAAAKAAEQAEDFEAAVEHLDALDDLRDDAADVGVTLAVPDNYAATRSRLMDEALAAVLRRGERAEQDGDWREALDAYERAERYARTPEMDMQLAEMQARVHLKWAEDEADRGYFRAAYERAGSTLALLGPDHPLSRRARTLQADALDIGTQFAALLPLGQTQSVARAAPALLLRDLNDVLTFDFWTAPPPFVAPVDPVRLRRALRHLDLDRSALSRRDAAEVGRFVEADLVVTGEITDYEEEERNIRNREREATLRGRASSVDGPATTTYLEQTVTLDVEATLDYRIIDPRSRRVLDQGTVRASTSERIERGVYDGDYRDLDLSGAERELFEETERLGREALLNDLVDELAERYAERVYDDVLRAIP